MYDAINANKKTICVYGHIDLGNIDAADKEITLKAGQKLVGVGYFGYSDSEVDKFSSISATATTYKNMINITQDGCLVSDLSINYSNEATIGNSYAISIYGSAARADLSGLDIKAKFSDINYSKAAIYLKDYAVVKIHNDLVVRVSGENSYGIFVSKNAYCNILSGTNVDIETSGNYGFGIYVYTNSVCNIDLGSNVKISTLATTSHGIRLEESSICNMLGEVSISLQSGQGIRVDKLSTYNIAGNLYIETNSSGGIFLSSVSSNNTVNILSSAQIYFNTSSSAIINSNNGGRGNNILNIAAGAKLAFEKDGTTKWYQLEEDYKDENTSTSQVNTITADNVATTIKGIAETSAWVLPTSIENDSTEEKNSNSQNLLAYQNQFNTALKEYDKLLSDCSYQGINLLKDGNLKLTFDENRQHIFNISGRDITSKALNINEALWQTQGDINQAIDELNASITTLRSLAEELGNQYSIITTRINFTEGLTDVLETGADDLTLADMNEASAQYLSLQTRQQLAINSLSLAAQSAQSILSLF